MMPEERAVSHSRDDETWEAKARWFRTLSVDERIDVLTELTDLILTMQPDLLRKKPHAQPIPGRIQVLEEA